MVLYTQVTVNLSEQFRVMYLESVSITLSRLPSRRFSMHGYPAVRGCKVDVMSVSCRQQLKYILKDMHVTAPYPCHRSPTGRQVAANLVDL